MTEYDSDTSHCIQIFVLGASGWKTYNKGQKKKTTIEHVEDSHSVSLL